MHEFNEDDALMKQSTALTEVIKDALVITKHQLNRMYVILAISLFINLLTVIGFLYYESQFEYSASDTTITNTTTTTQSTSGDNCDINNVNGNQYNDNAVHEDGE